MKLVKQQVLTGERALFQSKDLQISYSTFADGESPLKEGKDIKIDPEKTQIIAGEIKYAV